MINVTELKKIQDLAKIDLANDEFEQFSDKLDAVIKMIDKLQEVDCANVKPLRSVCDMKQRLFKDQANNNDISEELFSNVPKQGANLAKEVKYFIVPKVIE